MNEAGWIIALWATMVPIVMMALLFLPPYGMALWSIYNVYGDQVWAKWDDVSFILNTMEALVRYGINQPNLGFMQFYLPALGPFVVGCIASPLLMFWFYKYIRSVFVAS